MTKQRIVYDFPQNIFLKLVNRISGASLDFNVVSYCCATDLEHVVREQARGIRVRRPALLGHVLPEVHVGVRRAFSPVEGLGAHEDHVLDEMGESLVLPRVLIRSNLRTI